MVSVKVDGTAAAAGELKALESTARSTDSRMKTMGSSLRSIGSSMMRVGGTLSATVTPAIGAVGVGMVKLASDAEETGNKFRVVFGKQAPAMNKWITSLQKIMPATRAEIQEMSASMQLMLEGMGIAPKRAQDMSKQLVTLSGDLASFNNIPVAEAQEAITGALRGEYDMLQRFVPAVSAAKVEQQAMKMGLGDTTEEISAQDKALAIYELTMKSTKDAQGDMARTVSSSANSFKFLWRDVKEAATAFGKDLLPVITPIVQKLSGLVKWFGTLSPRMRAVIVAAGIFAAAIGPVILVLGGLVTVAGIVATSIGAIATGAAIAAAAIPALAAVGLLLFRNWGKVSGVFQRARAAIAPLIATVRNLLVVIKGMVTGGWTEKTSKAFLALSPAMKKASLAIGSFVGLIKRGFAAAMKFIVSQSQYVVKFFVKNWPLIRKVGGDVIEGLVKLIKGILGGLVVFWRLNHKEIVNILKAAWNIIKTIVSTTIKVILGIIKTGMQLLSGDWKGAWKTIGNTVDIAAKGIMDILRSLVKIAYNILKAGWNVIKALTQAAWEAVKNYIGDKLTSAWNKAKEISANLRDGLKQAWEEIKDGAATAWEAIKDAMQNPIETAYNNIKGFLNNIIGIVNTVLKAFGKDPLPLIGGGETPDTGRKTPTRQMPGRPTSSGVRAFARGGIAGPGRMGIVGEGGDEEAVVNLRRRTPESQHAFRVAAKSPNARGYRSGYGEGLGATHYNVAPVIRSRADRISGATGTSWNTYYGHGEPGGSTEDYTVDFWGPGGRGAPISTSAGFKTADMALGTTNPNVLYAIRQGEMWRDGTWRPWSQDPHYDHSHVSWVSPRGTGSTGGGTGPSLAELMWKMLSGLLPNVPSFGDGVVASAASSYLNSYKGWIHDWLISKFGGSSGSLPGGKSPSGLTLGDAIAQGGWPSNLQKTATGVGWEESSARADATNGEYRGIFQMGRAAAADVGADYNKLFDPVYNSTAAAKYFNKVGWGAWEAYPPSADSMAKGNVPVTGYDYGGLITQDHLAMMHAGELALPLNHPRTAPLVQAIAGTDAIERELASLRQALTDSGIKVSGYGKEAERTIVVGARQGGLGAMESTDGKSITVATVNEVQRNARLSGKVR